MDARRSEAELLHDRYGADVFPGTATRQGRFNGNPSSRPLWKLSDERIRHHDAAVVSNEVKRLDMQRIEHPSDVECLCLLS